MTETAELDLLPSSQETDLVEDELLDINGPQLHPGMKVGGKAEKVGDVGRWAEN